MDAFGQAARAENVQLLVGTRWSRPAAVRGEHDPDCLAHCSKVRRKSLRRARRRLEQHGSVDLRLHCPESSRDPLFRAFLNLENRGWKRREATSLLGAHEDLGAFQESIDRFAQQRRIVIAVLRCGRRIAAASLNLLAGDTLFALKIGWDLDLAEGSPGVWAELLLPQLVFDEFPQVAVVDGCAQPGSYLEQLWPGRRELAALDVNWSSYGRLWATFRHSARTVKNFIGEWLPT
ncbi:MAG: GNAT family N-acetyltransferase [Planctomycetaceae bacterium]|nr:GNAT family N-acetyltransferase [Planctomycetaceae bacterium]